MDDPDSFQNYDRGNLCQPVRNPPVYMETVSYTHLDVYKRQPLALKEFNIVYLLKSHFQSESGFLK